MSTASSCWLVFTPRAPSSTAACGGCLLLSAKTRGSRLASYADNNCICHGKEQSTTDVQHVSLENLSAFKRYTNIWGICLYYSFIKFCSLGKNCSYLCCQYTVFVCVNLMPEKWTDSKFLRKWQKAWLRKKGRERAKCTVIKMNVVCYVTLCIYWKQSSTNHNQTNILLKSILRRAKMFTFIMSFGYTWLD